MGNTNPTWGNRSTLWQPAQKYLYKTRPIVPRMSDPTCGPLIHNFVGGKVDQVNYEKSVRRNGRKVYFSGGADTTVFCRFGR